MEGIPPARASDNEEVSWALETAESLWKRDARVDAIVWLRRAAQEADQSGDKARASELSLGATALTEAMSRASAHARASLPSSVPPPAHEGDIDALLAAGDEAPVDGEAEELLEDDLEELDPGDLVSLAPTTPIPTGEPSRRDPSADPSSEVPTPVVHAEDGYPEPLKDLPGITRMGEGALSAMDLAGVAALAGLTDAVRDRVVSTAVVILCMADVVVPDFALALVLDGEVTARVDDGAIVAQLGPGATWRARGTIDTSVVASFAVTADDTTLAIWSEASLARALADAPTVDAALRAEGDRMQAWAQVAASPMAVRLHEEVRLRLGSRLTARVLRPGAELIRTGEQVPGLFLVGAGKITIDEPLAAVVGPGRFVFAGATLSAARASATARAGDGGAVVLCADRRTTQELCVTEPLLLEVLAADS
jgi:hypothetical protein